jgi:hypothetical protein
MTMLRFAWAEEQGPILAASLERAPIGVDSNQSSRL